jgi:hypothetical protein
MIEISIILVVVEKPIFSLIKHRSGILLIGGAEGGKLGEDQATKWLLNRAKGGNYFSVALWRSWWSSRLDLRQLSLPDRLGGGTIN